MTSDANHLRAAAEHLAHDVWGYARPHEQAVNDALRHITQAQNSLAAVRTAHELAEIEGLLERAGRAGGAAGLGLMTLGLAGILRKFVDADEVSPELLDSGRRALDVIDHLSSLTELATMRPRVSSATEGAGPDRVPSLSTVFTIVSRALSRGDNDDVQVLGWADNSIMWRGEAAGAGRKPGWELNFTVAGAPRISHEDEVIVVAVVPPHPDEASLDDLVAR